MNIAIDISQVIYETGVSTYTKELVKHLLKVDTQNKYLLYGGSLRRRKDLHSFTDELEGNFVTKFFSIPPTLADIMWNKLHTFKIENLLGKIDVLHSSDWTQPPTNAFTVTTVHDLVPLLMPAQTDPKIVAAHTKRLHWIKEEVDMVIVPSISAKQDLQQLGVESNQITVIPEAPADRFTPQSTEIVSTLKKKYGIKGKYLLAVGNVERKNIKRIIEAFHQVRTGLHVDNLVVVGRGNSNYGDTTDVVFTGHVLDQELPALYSGAEALVYASLYEGFGLPVLEAFACHCPVITSNRSSLPEVAGDAAILVNPEKVDEIAVGIEKILNDREPWVVKGKKQIQKFSWERTAKETLKIYNQVK